jgi:hypothetical protein
MRIEKIRKKYDAEFNGGFFGEDKKDSCSHGFFRAISSWPPICPGTR